MKIFVLHYSKLVERKKHIIEQFKKNSIIDYEFIERYDAGKIIEEESNLFTDTYKKETMSLHLKHFYVYKEIAEKYESGLIFEDDVILCEDFMVFLQSYLSELDDYDMLFIGSGCNLHIDKDRINPNQHIYRKSLYPTSLEGDGASRCCDSYIVTNKCAKKLCDYISNGINKISKPVDLWLNDAARDNQFEVFWAEPSIVIQGSECGLFHSSH
jgi:GR25 family glycosyltransferase involved in LPS biosynthesis